jgi:hypothetical protein
VSCVQKISCRIIDKCIGYDHYDFCIDSKHGVLNVAALVATIPWIQGV